MESMPKEVAAKYKILPGHGVGEYVHKGHKIDLQTVSLEKADELVENGFPYLIKKKK